MNSTLFLVDRFGKTYENMSTSFIILNVFGYFIRRFLTFPPLISRLSNPHVFLKFCIYFNNVVFFKTFLETIALVAQSLSMSSTSFQTFTSSASII